MAKNKPQMNSKLILIVVVVVAAVGFMLWQSNQTKLQQGQQLAELQGTQEFVDVPNKIKFEYDKFWIAIDENSELYNPASILQLRAPGGHGLLIVDWKPNTDLVTVEEYVDEITGNLEFAGSERTISEDLTVNNLQMKRSVFKENVDEQVGVVYTYHTVFISNDGNAIYEVVLTFGENNNPVVDELIASYDQLLSTIELKE